FQKLLWYDLICVDVRSIERDDQTFVNSKCLHHSSFRFRVSGFRFQVPGPSGSGSKSMRVQPETYLYSQFRTSTKCPAIAAAAAIAGLTRCVRPPRPCRPSKFRLLVEAQRSPGCRISGFIPRHMEQPDSRHSKPAARKISCSPSCSAACFTDCDPGTTMALTFGFTRYPFATRAAARK